MDCTASSVCRTARSCPRGGVLFCLQIGRQVSVICDNRHYAPVFLIARVSMLQQPKHRDENDENDVAVYRPHHDQRDDRVDRVRCRPSGNRIVLPSGLPHGSAVIPPLGPGEAAWGWRLSTPGPGCKACHRRKKCRAFDRGYTPHRFEVWCREQDS